MCEYLAELLIIWEFYLPFKIVSIVDTAKSNFLASFFLTTLAFDLFE